jgi:putative FmdB family regulatory protein
MPLYEYRCDACEQLFEQIQKFSDPPVEACPLCGKGPVTRLLSSPAIQFKGEGWYITDYARKGKSGGENSTKAAKDESSSETKTGSDDKKTAPDTKPASSDSTTAKSDKNPS